MAEEVTYKNISPAELAGQDLNKFTCIIWKAGIRNTES